MSNTLIYVRVSTKEQVDDGNSLATQERLCRDYANKHELTVPADGFFVEEGESAKTADRTALQKMLKYAALNKDTIDYLLIYRIDRLSRDTADYANLKVFFNSVGIKVVSISENLDDDPVGRFIENTLAGVAQLDNEIRAERSKNGMIDAVREGRWQWQAPLGYINTRVDGKKNIAPDHTNNTANLLNEAWQLLDCGYSFTATRKILTQKGLMSKSGKKIGSTSFNKLFSRPIYKGVIDKFGLEIISPTIKPVVDVELFDRVYARLYGVKKAPHTYKRANPEFPLRGVLLCSERHVMTASAPRGNGGRYPKYHCSQCRGKGTSHNKALVESKFVSKLNDMGYDKKLVGALRVAIEETWEYHGQTSKKEVARLRKRLLELDAQDNEIARKNLRGVFTDEHTRKLLADNALERTQLKLEQAHHTVIDRDLEDILNYGVTSLEQIGDLWNNIEDVFVKQRFQKWAFPAGIVWDGHEFGTAKMPLCLSIKNKIMSKNNLMVIPAGIEPALPD